MTRPSRAAAASTNTAAASTRRATGSTTRTASTPGDTESAEVQITRLYERIAGLDEGLIDLWRERVVLCQRVGDARAAAGKPRLMVAREHEILARYHGELGAVGVELGLLVLRSERGKD